LALEKRLGLSYARAMGLVEDIERVGTLIDRYYAKIADTEDIFALIRISTDADLVASMQTNRVDAFGHPVWQPMKSTAREGDLAQLEQDVGAEFPPLFRAYALSRCHFFVEFHGLDHRFLLPDFPPGLPLKGLSLHADPSCVTLGLLPFGSYDDAYGPVCFDLESRAADGDCPLVWIDHEFMSGLEEYEWNRARVQLEIQPLYSSFKAMLEDLLGPFQNCAFYPLEQSVPSVKWCVQLEARARRSSQKILSLPFRFGGPDARD